MTGIGTMIGTVTTTIILTTATALLPAIGTEIIMMRSGTTRDAIGAMNGSPIFARALC